jgi:hypothetical protein
MLKIKLITYTNINKIFDIMFHRLNFEFEIVINCKKLYIIYIIYIIYTL